jgi:hypothetical protein
MGGAGLKGGELNPVPPAGPLTAGPAPRGTVEGDTAARSALLEKQPWDQTIAKNIENSDFGQNHPTGGKVLGNIAQVGGSLLDTLIPKGLASRLPFTEAGHQRQVGLANSALTGSETAAKDAAQTGLQTAQTGAIPSEIALREAQTQNDLNPQPKPKEEKWTVSPEFTGPNGEPVEVEENSGQMRLAGGETAFKRVPKPGENKEPTPQQATYDDLVKHGLTPEQALEKTKERPTVINQNSADAALDREATRLAKPYEKGIADANTQLDKIADARAMVNGSAEAQALGVPKVLTALVSGAGSGVRITQPELNAIAKARGISGDIEGTLRQWAGKGKLTPEQQKQLTGILDDVQQRLMAKQTIYAAALDQINGAASREDIIKADKEARQKLNDIERQGTQKMIRARDPQGNLQEAPEGTALPKGWKAE